MAMRWQYMNGVEWDLLGEFNRYEIGKDSTPPSIARIMSGENLAITSAARTVHILGRQGSWEE